PDAARGQQHQEGLLAAVLPKFFDRLEDRLGHDHHARPAPVRRVVHLLVLVPGVVPEIDQVDLHLARLLGPLQDALAHHPRKHRGEERHHVNDHRRTSITSACTPRGSSYYHYRLFRVKFFLGTLDSRRPLGHNDSPMTIYKSAKHFD